MGFTRPVHLKKDHNSIDLQQLDEFLPELFGLQSMGVILGSITFAYTLGGATGPIISGYLFDLLGSYRPAFFIAAFVAIVSFSFALVLKLPVVVAHFWTRAQIKQRR